MRVTMLVTSERAPSAVCSIAMPSFAFLPAEEIGAQFHRHSGIGGCADERKRLPEDVKLTNWYDQSELILDSASSLRNAIIIGVVLAALVLLIFLRDWKVTLAAVIAVPAVLAGTTLILKLMGQSFNIMTLGGMAAAIGLIIDDAIVMIEHIERRLAEADELARGLGDARRQGIGRIHQPLGKTEPVIRVAGGQGR